jgi:transposase
VSKGQAAEILGVSERHVWRILAAYRKEGAVALAHRNRGRRPSNATSEATMAEVVALARIRYQGANHTHLTELLAEREGISLNRSVVRRILVGAGLASPRRRRPPRHRVRRQRMPQEGMLVQIDASHHPWLEERGPRFALLLAVDDATSTVPHALFHQVEDTFGYFLLMEGMARRAGVPLALYSDRHAVFQHQREPRQAPAGPTQFGRAMQELGVQQIFARSPQAKGRVERTAGTLQDRLVTELRLAGPLPLRRPTRSCGTSCHASTNDLESRPINLKAPTSPSTQTWTWRAYSASNTAARWPRTTRSNTTGTRSNCFPASNDPATLASRWKSRSNWTANL